MDKSTQHLKHVYIILSFIQNKHPESTHTQKRKPSPSARSSTGRVAGAGGTEEGPQSRGRAGDSDQVSTVARPLAWLPSSSRAPNVQLKPGPPAAAHPQQVPQTRSTPWHAGHCRAPSLPREDGGQLPMRDMSAPPQPSLSRQDTRAQVLWETSRQPCAGEHVRAAAIIILPFSISFSWG